MDWKFPDRSQSRRSRSRRQSVLRHAVGSTGAAKASVHARAHAWEHLERRVMMAAQVGGTISSDVHWSGTVQLTSNVLVAAGVTVTIDAGTVIKAGNGMSFTVDGTMLAQGAAGAPVVFTSVADDSVGDDLSGAGVSTGTRGQWRQLRFSDSSDVSQLDYVEVRNAGNLYGQGNGSGFAAAVQLDGSDARLTNVTITAADQDGVRITSGSPRLSGVSVVGARNQAFEVDVAAAPVYTGLSASGTALNGVMINGGTIATSRTWDAGGLAIYVNGSITVAGTGGLTVVPGQVVKFANDGFLAIDGTLTANATGGNPIIFTSYRDDTAGGDTNADGSTSGVRGDWRALFLNDGSDASVLSNVDVRFAGNQYGQGNGSGYTPAITMTASDAHLTDVRVVNVDNRGVSMAGGAPVLTRVSVNGARHEAFAADLAANPALVDLSAGNAALNGYLLGGGDLAVNRTWSFGGLVVQLGGAIRVAESATLTIVPGQIVKFRNEQYIEVDGTLRAVGTAAQPITFTSYRDDSAGGDTNANGLTAGAAGDWWSLFFDAASGASEVTNVDVKFAGNRYSPGHGSGYTSAITVRGSALKVTDTRLTDVDSEGVNIATGSAPTLTNVSVTRGRHNAFHGALNAAPTLVNLTATDTGADRYLLDGGDISGSRTWDFGGLPVQLNGSVNVPVGATLTVVPGQVVKLGNEQYISVYGTLSAAGTAARPIVFTSSRDDSFGGDANNDGATAPARGDWWGMFFYAGSDASVLENARVSYAGNRYSPGHGSGFQQSILIENNSATFRHVEVRETDWAGIRLQGTGSATLDDVHVEGARNVPYSSSLTVTPLLNEITEANAAIDAWYFDGGTLPGDRAWSLVTMPYIFGSSITVPAGVKLTVGAGAVLKWANEQYVDVQGTLTAVGTLSSPVVFTSRRDDSVGGDTFRDGANGPLSGDWRGFFLKATSTGVVFDYADVRYAGNQYSPGHGSGFEAAVRVIGSSPTIRNTVIRDSDGQGISLAGGSAILDQLTIVRSRFNTVTADLASTATFSGVRSVDNNGDRVVVTGGTLPGDRTFDFGGMAAYFTNDLIVPAGVTLTVVPGQVLKFSNTQYLQVNGTLSAVGTAAQPVVFTSYRDDQSAGDSNNDGAAASVPTSGDWRGIFLYAGSDASVLENVVVRYSGNQYSPGHGSGFEQSIMIRGASPTLRNIQVASSDSTGIRMETAGTPTLDGVHVTGSRYAPFSSSFAVDPAVLNVTASGNGIQAFAYDGGTIPANRTFALTTMPYVFGNDVTVAAAATLTVGPGAVLKWATTQYLAVNGKLMVMGTAVAPVKFTSREDDSAGGDTYNNGPQGTAGGQWRGLFIDGGGSVLNELRVSYAGNQYSPGHGSGFEQAVAVRAGTTTANGLRVIGSDGSGIAVSGGASLVMTGGLVAGSRFNNVAVSGAGSSVQLSGVALSAAQTGVSVASGSTATVTGSTFDQLTTAVTTANTAFGRVTATGNWWGSGGGPNDPSAADGRANANPAGQNVGNWVDYSNWLGARPALAIGPAVAAHTPVLTSGNVASIDVTFTDPVDMATFTKEDVSVTGPGVVVVSGVSFVGGTTYRITLETPISVTGTYQVSVGPDVRDSAGFGMDQNRNGVEGEAADKYVGTLVIDRTGPRVVAVSPAGSVATAVDHVDVTFSKEISPGSFSVGDVSLTAPNGLGVQVLSVTRLSGTQYRIGFAVQASNGAYTLTVGPGVSDLAGNAMDQDQDGTAGEASEDRFVGTFTVARLPLRVVSVSPSGHVAGSIDHLDVTFSAPIQNNSFTAADVVIQGAQQFANVTGVTRIDDVTYRVTFDRITASGEFTVRVGPGVADTAGELMDQDDDGTPGELEDRFVTVVTIDGAGPQIVAQSVTGTSRGPVTSIDVTFGETILADTFTAADVTLTGPNGPVAITGVTLVAGNTYRITFPAQTASGAYQLAVGPNVLDLSGQPMNQDGDATDGEAVEDVYRGTFTIDSAGPRLVSTTPSGTVLQPFTTIDLEFSESLLGTSIGTSDVTVTGPAGAIAVTGLQLIDATHVRVTLAAQQGVPGSYQVTVGPDITDLVGNPMDQNQNGTTGEATDVATFVLVVALPDLTVTSVDAPATIAAGDNLAVNWVVGNNGGASAGPSWQDYVVLSPNGVFGDADDILVGTFARGASLAAGLSYAGQATVQVPFGLVGNYTLFVRTDRTSAVVEGDEANNLIARGIEIAASLPPNDLQVDAVTASANGLTGQTITVTWRVSNIGIATTPGAWSDRVYLSTNVGSSRVDLQACKLEYSIVSPK